VQQPIAPNQVTTRQSQCAISLAVRARRRRQLDTAAEHDRAASRDKSADWHLAVGVAHCLRRLPFHSASGLAPQSTVERRCAYNDRRVRAEFNYHSGPVTRPLFRVDLVGDSLQLLYSTVNRQYIW